MNNELTHWGIKGQKWGVRRYQNEDGSLTPAGEKRYNKKGYTVRQAAKLSNDYSKRESLDLISKRNALVKQYTDGEITRKEMQEQYDREESKSLLRIDAHNTKIAAAASRGKNAATSALIASIGALTTVAGMKMMKDGRNELESTIGELLATGGIATTGGAVIKGARNDSIIKTARRIVGNKK